MQIELDQTQMAGMSVDQQSASELNAATAAGNRKFNYTDREAVKDVSHFGGSYHNASI